jgi:hypothetical protein
MELEVVIAGSVSPIAIISQPDERVAFFVGQQEAIGRVPHLTFNPYRGGTPSAVCYPATRRNPTVYVTADGLSTEGQSSPIWRWVEQEADTAKEPWYLRIWRWLRAAFKPEPYPELAKSYATGEIRQSVQAHIADLEFLDGFRDAVHGTQLSASALYGMAAVNQRALNVQLSGIANTSLSPLQSGLQSLLGRGFPT